MTNAPEIYTGEDAHVNPAHPPHYRGHAGWWTKWTKWWTLNPERLEAAGGGHC